MSGLSSSRLLVVASVLIGFGTLGFYCIEGMISKDAEGNPWINAFYCAVITLTTVGYGDICPSSDLNEAGRMFIIALSFLGLGMFCGPIMDFSSSWKQRIPGGATGPGLVALCFGTLLFSQIEGMSKMDAAYFTVITGTTVGYGDLGPKTEFGRLATAFFAILVVNVIGGMLEPAKHYLSQLCVVPPEKARPKASPESKREDGTTESKEKKIQKKED